MPNLTRVVRGAVAGRLPRARSAIAAIDLGALRRLPFVSAVTGLGWTAGVASVGAWLAGAWLGWTELKLAAAFGVCVLLLCALLMIGRTALRITLTPMRKRMMVGESTTIDVAVTNAGSQRLVLVMLEIVVGARTEPITLPFMLAGGDTFPTSFPLVGAQRGVIAIGPATSVRGDPFGLLRRRVFWAESTEVFVYPRTTRLDPFGTGLLHDLEGSTTEDVSMSDLAFHTLRQYAPGDDRRHIHWPSSAKLATARPEGTFLVRQFRDTRRTHVLILVDGDQNAYDEPEDFETAISAGASIAVQAVQDKLDATMLVADQRAYRRLGHETSRDRVLDVFARAGASTGGLGKLIARGVADAPSTTFALIVTGATQPASSVRRVTARLPRSVRTTVIQINSRIRTGLVMAGQPTVLTLASLDDLRGLLRRGDIT